MIKKRLIDINCDMGESFGIYKLGNDEEVINFVSSVNIACGFHGGDPGVIKKTVLEAGKRSINLGAHPSFPDLQGFGRRRMDISDEDLLDSLIYQIGAVKTFAEAFGFSLNHVKPHGALYNLAAKDIKTSRTIIDAIILIDEQLILIAPHKSELYLAAQKKGVNVMREFFADRNYNSDGTLVSRNNPDALIHDADFACNRVIDVLDTGKVHALDGATIPMELDTICVHGDNREAVTFAKKLRDTLAATGWL